MTVVLPMGYIAMIKAVIFDLDGTLVQTETLKAASYGKASVELCPACGTEQEVTAAFKDVVGRSRREVSETLMKQFKLEDAARKRMQEMGVSEPWEAFAEMRMRIYDKMLADPNLIRSHQLAHNVDLLRHVRRQGYKTALATTSARDAALRVLEELGIVDEFDVIATADDVTNNKPDPEIYQLIFKKFEVSARESLAIEDSPAGVTAATASGAWCIAVTTEFTRDAIHESKLLDERWIVDDPKRLKEVFNLMIEERKADSGEDTKAA